MTEPTVSVGMITYNHAPYITRAIEGVLQQKTKFPFELIIGEDCSSDGTRKVVFEYQERYPHIIRVITSDRNVGAKENGYRTWKACRGKYIALCEGDDYWTSPEKLQKQVDFLDNHPECAICFHNVTRVYDDGSHEPRNYCSDNQKKFSTVEDLLVTNFIPTCSTMFRRGLFGEFPDWYYSMPMGDWPLHILNALHGKIGYINEVMGVYQIHRGGVWSSQSLEDTDKAIIQFYDVLNTHVEYKYRKIINRVLHNWCLKMSEEYAGRGNSAEARSYAIRCLTKNFMVSRKLFKMLLKLYVPILYNLLMSLKRQLP